jgi:hypothetical protein
VIVRFIWQKLSSVERDFMLIVTHSWQPFSQSIGNTSLIIRKYWQTPTLSGPS